MRKSMQWLLVLSVVILGLIGETTADASAWHYGSFPKAVRGYWHDNISKNKMATQYHYTKKYQNVELYTKDNGKWFHGVMNRINTYNGSLRYKIIGHHKYYFKATTKENNKWYIGADRMILTKKSHHKLTMKLHYKETHKWYNATTLYAGKVK